jgi:hypothetical protein
MTKVYASILALGLLSAVGCKGLPGGECKFNKGEVSGSIQGDAKAFMDAALDLKKTADAMDAEWNAEIKATADELKVEATPDAVLAKVSANMKAAVDAKCTIEFSADMNASASGSADAKGSATASVNVKFDVKCDAKVDAAIKGNVDVTVGAVKAHFPKLLGITIKAKDLLPKAQATVEAGSKVMGSIKDPMILPEIKCAVEATTGIKASVDVKVSFQASASASAKGEGSGAAKAG